MNKSKLRKYFHNFLKITYLCSKKNDKYNELC
jgi:hypothetical protein